MKNKSEVAIFGGGCFWCTEAIFRMLKGVNSVVSGYSGGGKENPSYDHVSSGSSGHAEVIKIEFDPSVIKFNDLLEVFFAVHDSTTLNRQGNDVGEQYRSVIFYTSDDQKAKSENYIKNLESESEVKGKIVTQLEKLKNFYPAEEYHQNYYVNNQDKPYCQVIISPKVEKFKQNHPELIK